MNRSDPSREPVAPRDAATVILLREEAGGGFEVYMVRRHGKSGFMAGAFVFPGGTLDEADRSWTGLAGRDGAEAAELLGEDDMGLALGLHVAAIRETFEEAGVLLADGTSGIDLAAIRTRLNAGEPFRALAEEHGLVLRLDKLVPWARWVTPIVERRRYDARFFLARAPREQEAEHDRVEVTAGEWLTPRGALEKWERGEIQLPPPTLRTIEQLADLRSVDGAFAVARENAPPRVVMPHFVPGELPALVLPGDPEHPIRERRISGPSRFVLENGTFRSAPISRRTR